MIHIVIGTKAQLIKMAPIMRRLHERGIAYNYIATGQHHSTMSDLHANFAIRPPDLRLYDGPDIVSIPQMLSFGARILWMTVHQRASLLRGDRHGIVLVHGDTFSTLLGALMARLLSAKVGHVESGLRSFNLWAPFPEEVIRLATFRLAHYYFCPGAWALQNLRGFTGYKIDTGANTLVDALRYAMPAIADTSPAGMPAAPFGVVTLHRFENIHSRQALSRVVSSVKLLAERHRLLFVLHVPTAAKLRRFDLYSELAGDPNITLSPRYDYFDFMRLVSRAEFVVSDGGSNQEECYYLGKPVLLLRDVTERTEGLGANAVLSRFDPNAIRDFADNYHLLARPPLQLQTSPTDIIIDACAQFYRSPGA